MSHPTVVHYLCLACCLAVVAHPAAGQQDEGTVPSWVKQTAGWWSEGLISDGEFLAAIRYLIEEGVLVVGVDDVSAEPATTPDCRKAGDPVQSVTWSLGPHDQSANLNGSYAAWLDALGGLDAARDAVAAGFGAWAEYNPSLEFHELTQPSACGYPHVNVTVGQMPSHTAIGYACIDCLHDGAEMVLDEDWWRMTFTSLDVPFNNASVRNVVAHEFGHVLGLEHYYEDPLHLMRVFYAEDVYCTPAGLSGTEYYTGLTYEYDDMGWVVPPYLFSIGEDGKPVHPPQHPSSSFFVKSAQYDRVSRTLYVTFTQDVLDVELDYIRMTGSDGKSGRLYDSEVTYLGNVVEIAMPEVRGEKFDDMLCADLELSERSVRRHDTTFLLPQTLIVEVIR